MKNLKLRLKGNTKWLDQLAKEVNFVWNYVNDLSAYNIKNKGKFLTTYDIGNYLSGCTKGDNSLNIIYSTAEEIASMYTVRRKTAKKRKLKYRSNKRSLGWVPFKRKKDIWSDELGVLKYRSHKFKVWDSYGLDKYKDHIRNGSFNQDSRGRWYLNLTVDVEDQPSTGSGEVGIDLGLKDFAVTSDGERFENPKFYRSLEEKIKKAQRAKKKDRVRVLHEKAKNCRKDFLHKLTNNIVSENCVIFVGDVSSTKLAKTNMAKSVLDAGWGMFKSMLEYKAIRRQVHFERINEAWTSQTCNVCKNRTGPKGLEGLVIREWVCSECNSVHDRDINAAKNILALGHQRLAEGTL